MMDRLRKQASKVFMSFLFGLLILSFAVWGIGDVYRGTGRVDSVAEVGGTSIDSAVFSRMLSNEVSRIQSQFNGRLDIDQIRALGVGERLLQRMITGALLDEQAANMGLVVSDEQIRRRIAEDPAFHNQAGNFDRARFDQILQLNGVSEEFYINTVRRDMMREQLGEAATDAVVISREFVDDFYRYREERRIADTIQLPVGDGADIAAPDEAELEATHQSYAARFQRPEFRTLALVELNAEDMMDEVHVDEAELAAEFEARRDDFALPERRNLEQVLFETAEDAAAFKEAVDGGRDFAEAAGEPYGREPIGMSELTLEDLSVQLPDSAESLFALGAAEVSEPVESPFGWHVFRVNELLPAYEPRLEDHREELHAELAERQAVDSLVSLANQLDDELAGGATLEEAAASVGATPRELEAVDRDGRDRAGEELALPDAQNLLSQVFAAEVGEPSLVTELPEGGYYVFRVDRVTPAALRPLAEVRDQVIDLWRREEARQRVLIDAEALADRIRLGTAMAAAAESEGLSLGRTAPLDRFGSDAGGTPDLTAKLFSLAVDEVAVAETPDGWVVAKLAVIEPGVPTADPEAVDSLAQGLTESLRADAMNAFTRELDRNFGVTVNQAAVEAAMSAY